VDIKIPFCHELILSSSIANFSYSKDLNQAKRMRDDLMLNFMNLQAAKN